jgi:hypothetical protein
MSKSFVKKTVTVIDRQSEGPSLAGCMATIISLGPILSRVTMEVRGVDIGGGRFTGDHKPVRHAFGRNAIPISEAFLVTSRMAKQAIRRQTSWLRCYRASST